MKEIAHMFRASELWGLIVIQYLVLYRGITDIFKMRTILADCTYCCAQQFNVKPQRLGYLEVLHEIYGDHLHMKAAQAEAESMIKGLAKL